MNTNNNDGENQKWKDIAQSYNIKSWEAYKKLFDSHSHPLADSGNEKSYVTMDDAIEAIKIVEKNIDNIAQKWIDEYHNLIKTYKQFNSFGEILLATSLLNRANQIREILYHLGYDIKSNIT